MADGLPTLKQVENDPRDRFGRFDDKVKALLLFTEIRIRAEQKNIISVETGVEPSEVPAQPWSSRRLSAGGFAVSKIDCAQAHSTVEGKYFVYHQFA